MEREFANRLNPKENKKKDEEERAEVEELKDVTPPAENGVAKV